MPSDGGEGRDVGMGSGWAMVGLLLASSNDAWCGRGVDGI